MIDKYNLLIDKWKSLSAEEKKSLLWGIGAVYSYHSCKIENDRTNWADIKGMFDDKMLMTKPDPITTAEVVDAYRAFDFFIKSLERKTTLDLNFIKQTHLLMTTDAYDKERLDKGERPGQFKKGFYVVGPNNAGSAPEEVQPELEQLLEEIREVDDKNVLTAAAYFHAVIENIHPFSDGNGRTGRLLMNYFFAQHDHPPVIVHEEDRLRYYEALELWNQNEDIEPLKDFLKEQGVRSWLRLDKEALKELRKKARTVRLKDLLTP